jgi:Xaa-Pro aminopeptidase
MFDLNSVQTAIRELQLDGWLLYDFRGLNVLARRVLQMPTNLHLTRRWFYYIPARGEPKKLVHKIEPGSLNGYPGQATTYLKWQELEAGVKQLLHGSKKIAMEYVPRNANPYVSRVDAGTVDLVKSFGVEIVSSGDLIQWFEACWTQEQFQLHLEAAKHTRQAYEVAVQFMIDEFRIRGGSTEVRVQDRIMEHFAANGLVTDHPPIVGVNAHAGDPHYAPDRDNDTPIKKGDLVLIDLWAKMNQPWATYSDLTRMFYIGSEVPAKFAEVFKIVAAARDAGIAIVRDAFAQKKLLQGWQVDDATRAVIEKAGYGASFIHRTGHSIGQETHGNGANMDNLETHEERRVLPKTCFSIEPGIYLPEFGVRSETNVYIDATGNVHVTGGELQTEITPVIV